MPSEQEILDENVASARGRLFATLEAIDERAHAAVDVATNNARAVAVGAGGVALASISMSIIGHAVGSREGRRSLLGSVLRFGLGATVFAGLFLWSRMQHPRRARLPQVRRDGLLLPASTQSSDEAEGSMTGTSRAVWRATPSGFGPEGEPTA
jgi:hypothetical protein